jgi:hypothetical protein
MWQATPFRLLHPVDKASIGFFTLCHALSFWLNNQDPDCVTAEACFNIDTATTAEGLPPVVISDEAAYDFARRNGFLNGAALQDVCDAMRTQGITQNGKIYREGPDSAVDWTNYAEVASAIKTSEGSLKIAVAANQFEDQIDETAKFSFLHGFTADHATDHCTGIAGTATADDLLSALNELYGTTTPLPPGLAPDTPCYLHFTWNQYQILEAASLPQVCDQALIRIPALVILNERTA